VNGEWKPLAAACLLILCIGLAYGLALSPSDPFLPYKTAIQNGSSDQRNANEKPAMFESPAFIGIAAFLQAIGAIGTVWLIYRQLMTSRAQLRAYVVVSSAGIVSADDDKETAPVAVVTIQNSGQTPAHDVVNVSGIAIDLFPPPPTLSLTITDHDFAAVGRSRETLGPGNTSVSRVSAGRLLMDEEKKGIIEGVGAIYVYGEIRYKDAFGKRRWTRYRLMMGGPVGIRGGQLAGCEEGNEAS
jgi:hypothetical protein